MDKQERRKSKYNLALKTSAISGSIVLLLLAVGLGLLLTIQSGLVDFLITEHVQRVEKKLDKDINFQKAALKSRAKINTDISANLIARLLNDLDKSALRGTLKPYMQFEEIVAIQVLDEEGDSFLCVWQTPEKVKDARNFPKKLKLDNKLSFTAKSVYKGTTIGAVKLYYTFAALDKQLKAAKKDIHQDITLFRKAANGRIQHATTIQIGLFLAVVVVLIFTIMVCLRILAIKPIQRVITGLDYVAAKIFNASSQISESSRVLAQNSSEQADSVEETISSLEEMSAMTRQNADNAGQADALVVETSNIVDEANGAMGELNHSIGEISKASDETSKIIKTIDEIAFQTNLLALNAAVEAARAGEAGAGFAVVADEVRNLAMRAAEAAKNTSELIETTSSKVKQGSTLVEKTNSAFSNVSESSKKVANFVSEIAAASKEQAEGINQITNAVNEMDQVTQRNASSAEESASASTEMNSQATQMKGFVTDLMSLVGGSSGKGHDHPRLPSGKKQHKLLHWVPSKRNRETAAMQSLNAGSNPQPSLPQATAEFSEF